MSFVISGSTVRFFSALAFAATLGAQTAPIPAEYQDLSALLLDQIGQFDAQVRSNWNGTKRDVVFAGELLTGNGNRGLALLSSSTQQGVRLELTRLQSLGVRAVVVQIGFPMLYPPFLQRNGTPQAYQGFLDFFKWLKSELQGRGMKLFVESGPLFPGVYSAGSGLNLDGYYQTLGLQEYVSGRGQVITTIAKEIAPDYLSIGSEPDTEAVLSGHASLASPQGYAGVLQQWSAQVRAAGVSNVPIGGGVGTWVLDPVSYVRALASAGLDFIDLHIYPLNRQSLMNTIACLDAADSIGKRVTISEAWPLKKRDSEYSAFNEASDPTAFSRDVWAFWAPVDQAFFGAMTKFAHWRNLMVMSAFWTKYFWTYLDYSKTSGMSPVELINQSLVAASQAIQDGTTSETGRAYSNAISPGGSQPIRALNGASLEADQLALAGIISVFSQGISAGAASPTDPFAPPETLSGVQVDFVDGIGARAFGKLYYVSESQINLVVPPGLRSGAASMAIRRDGRAISTATVSVGTLAPGIFSANANGSGPAAAIVVRTKADGTQATDLTFQCGAGPGSCANRAIDLGPQSDLVTLAFFGTGIRGGRGLSGVKVTVGDLTLDPSFAGPQPQYPGMDQVNVLLPRALAGRGEVTLRVTVDGVASRNTTIRFN